MIKSSSKTQLGILAELSVIGSRSFKQLRLYINKLVARLRQRVENGIGFVSGNVERVTSGFSWHNEPWRRAEAGSVGYRD